MVNLLATIFCIVAIIIMIRSAPVKYGSKFENVNVDEILDNDRMLNAYFKCLMDTGKCTTEGEELKKWLPEIIETKCKECTEKQKERSEKVMIHLYRNKNDMFKQLMDKYDPEGIYRERYQEDAKKLDIQV